MKSKVTQYIIAPADGFIGVEAAEKSFLSELQNKMSAEKTLFSRSGRSCLLTKDTAPRS